MVKMKKFEDVELSVTVFEEAQSLLTSGE